MNASFRVRVGNEGEYVVEQLLIAAVLIIRIVRPKLLAVLHGFREKLVEGAVGIVIKFHFMVEDGVFVGVCGGGSCTDFIGEAHHFEELATA